MPRSENLLPAPIVDEIAKLFVERHPGRFVYLEHERRWWDRERRNTKPPAAALLLEIFADIQAALLTMREQRLAGDAYVLSALLILGRVIANVGFYRGIILQAVRRLPGMSTSEGDYPIP
jgi:hypothetical protein